MELSIPQFTTIANFFSFTIAAMGAGAIFFFLSRSSVSPRYRPALMISGLVTTIACYHYFRIYISWGEGYKLTDNMMKTTPTPFNDAYRYADWFLTVPLLLAELVSVLRLPKGEGPPLLTKLVVAAALMIGLGYPGEVSSDTTTRWFFFGCSMVPFLYILFVLYTELTKSLAHQPQAVRGLVGAARLVLLTTWSFYPIAFATITITGTTSPLGQVALQIGYSIADITSKVGYGLLIYSIARVKSEVEGYNPDVVDSAPQAPVSPNASTRIPATA